MRKFRDIKLAEIPTWLMKRDFSPMGMILLLKEQSTDTGPSTAVVALEEPGWSTSHPSFSPVLTSPNTHGCAKTKQSRSTINNQPRFGYHEIFCVFLKLSIIYR